jgi:putative phosphoribosyl transferase
MPFHDRKDAGQQLARALARYKGEDCVVLALPRGGVPVAAEVAQALDAPLDLILVRKIGAPENPEFALGAVVDGGAPIVVRNRDVMALSPAGQAQFDAICARELAEIERRRKLYLGSRAPLDPRDKVAIVIDDGLATGATMRAALRATRQRKPRTLVMAVPVAPPDTLETFRDEADDIVCLESPARFGAVGYYYEDFRQTTDAEVIAALR